MPKNEIGEFVLDWVRALVGDNRSTIKSERDARTTYLGYCNNQPDRLFDFISGIVVQLSEYIKPHRTDRQNLSVNDKFVMNWAECIFDYGYKFGNCEWYAYYQKEFVEKVKDSDNAIEIFVAVSGVLDELGSVHAKLRGMK